MLISNLHKKKYKWSDKLDKKDALDWNHIVDLYKINFVKGYDRCVISEVGKPISLHIFTDASISAYGAVAYIITEGNKNVSKMLCSKSKVKPLNKKLTIPKLELCGFLLGLKLMKNLVDNKGETNFKSVHLWTYANCICNWVLSDKIHKNRFISNRVKKM